MPSLKLWFRRYRLLSFLCFFAIAAGLSGLFWAPSAFAQNPAISSVSPNPAVIPSPTSADITAGMSATVDITVAVTDGGKPQEWEIRFQRQQVYASPMPDTVWAYDQNYKVFDALPANNSITTLFGTIGAVTQTFPVKVELNNFTADGTYTERLRIALYDQPQNSTTLFGEAFIDLTITVSGLTPATTPSFTVSATTVSMGTAATPEFQAGTSAVGTLTLSIDDPSSVGTTLHVGVWNPYAAPIDSTMQARVDAGTWVSLEPRSAYATSKACTTTCTQTWDFRKLVSWTADPPGGPYTSQIRFELRKTSDGSVIATQNADIDLTVSQALSISADMTSIPFGTVASAGTYNNWDAMSVYTKSNVNHDLTIKSFYPVLLSSSGANDSALPIARLEWQNGDLMNGWNAVTDTSGAIYTQIAPYDGAVATVPLLFRITIAATDPKDTYTAYLVLEVVPS